jgi:hypothetical protein
LDIGDFVYCGTTGNEFKSIGTKEESILKDTARSDWTLFFVVGEISGDSGAILDTSYGVWNAFSDVT